MVTRSGRGNCIHSCNVSALRLAGFMPSVTVMRRSWIEHPCLQRFRRTGWAMLISQPR
jgi:hypothetical protein